MIGVTIYGNSGKPISVIYVLSGEFNGDVCFVIRVTIYGNRGKPISVIYVLDWFFDVNSMVMSVL